MCMLWVVYLVLRGRLACLHDGVDVSDGGGGRDVVPEGAQLLTQQLRPSRAVPVHAVVDLCITVTVIYDNFG